MTIVLNGSDLTVTQVIAVARHGAAVELAPGARNSYDVPKLPCTSPPIHVP